MTSAIAGTGRILPDHCCAVLHLADWLSEPTRQYLAHTAAGQSLREIARVTGEAPSTICRRIRRIEDRRDDPLFDEALRLLGAEVAQLHQTQTHAEEPTTMTAPFR